MARRVSAYAILANHGSSVKPSLIDFVQNRDGKGINLKLDSVPLTGHTVIREVTERHGEEPAEAETPPTAETPAKAKRKSAAA